MRPSAGHRAKKVLSELPTASRVFFLPSYSPELNPAERIFEEMRRHVEGKVYEDLEDKRREAESYLQELRAASERVLGACTAGGGSGKYSNRCRRKPRVRDVRHDHSESVLREPVTTVFNNYR